MRTSRISQETTRIFDAISHDTRARSIRSAKIISCHALRHTGTGKVKDEPRDTSDESDTATNNTIDIEDAVTLQARSSRKRKYGAESPPTTVISTLTDRTTKWTSRRKRKVNQEAEKTDGKPADSPTRAKAKAKLPARKSTLPDGTVQIHPPSNWEEIYDTVKRYRVANPHAPVDTMGCEDLFWQSAPVNQKRYHTLTALMLSSQTKDTVTAAAMQRLHTELVPQVPGLEGKPPTSGLTVANVLACDPKHLDHLIGKVGFHNNKTKYIKAAAKILKEEYNSEIPDTVEGLMRLPGVGPKMAYLCMSAAWGVDEGIGVDVHVHRITNLWGWHKTKNPEETRMWLEAWLPREKWHDINKMLVGLGQTVCLPIGRRCGECPLAGMELCKAEARNWKVKEKKVKVEKIKKDEEEVIVEVEGGIEVKEELVDS